MALDHGCNAKNPRGSLRTQHRDATDCFVETRNLTPDGCLAGRGLMARWRRRWRRDPIAASLPITLRLAHIGLTPTLECFEHCEIGWDGFLACIAAYVERGKGEAKKLPYRYRRVRFYRISTR